MRIVITGAPASGKTELIEKLRKHPSFADFVFFDELARRLLEENPSYRGNWPKFHLEIYRRQVAREDAVSGRPFVTDRGTVDAFAFHPETVDQVGTTLEREYQRYDVVIQLGSTASLGHAYYTRDNIRLESIPQALSIEGRITEAWGKHPGFHYVKAEYDFEQKYKSVLEITAGLAERNSN